MNSSHGAKRKGFTVIEMAVIIGIIVILAAILYPAFHPAVNHGGRGPRCQSNLKQIGLGVAQYTQDYDERYPLPRTGVAFATSRTWVDALYPYLKSQQLFHCPSDDTGGKNETISYGYNSHLRGANAQKLKYRAMMVVNYEVAGSPNATCGQTMKAVTEPTRHLDGANYAFADGHVKYLRPTQVFDASENGVRFAFKVP